MNRSFSSKTTLLLITFFWIEVFFLLHAESFDAPFNGKMNITRSTKQSTFSRQDALPSLPLPSLEQTIDRLVESAACLCKDNPTTLQRLTKEATEAKKSESLQKIHTVLAQKAAMERNWLTPIWEEMAYLRARYPLFINTNIFLLRDSDFPLDGKQRDPIARATVLVDEMNNFRKQLMAETFPVEALGNVPLCMAQYKKYYSTRIPQEGCDRLEVCKAQDLRYVTLMVDPGFMYAIEIDKCDAAAIKYCVQHAEELVAKGSREPILGALTTGDRDTWAKCRGLIANASPRNAQFFRMIEMSSCIVSLDLKSPAITNFDEGIVRASHGNHRNRFYDKSYAFIVSSNGVCMQNCDHTPMDAIVTAGLTVDDFIAYSKGHDVSSATGVPNGTHVIHMDWDIPNEVHTLYTSVISPSTHHMLQHNQLVICYFNKFGKGLLTKAKIHTDAFIQLSLQIAYYLDQENKFAPVYESAMTRSFYEGRTETIRALTTQAMDFVKAYVSPGTPAGTLKELFASATKQHSKLTQNAVRGQGCDRHILGLKVVAAKEGVPLPALLTTNPEVQSSGRWLLSTSQMMGLGGIGGFCHNVPEGYGACYFVRENLISITLACNAESGKTDIKRFRGTLWNVMEDLYVKLSSLSNI